jgi:hypothetical protein
MNITYCFSISEVTWQGQNIFVLNKVTVTPPYKPENVKGDVYSKAYIHIRKIVSIFWFHKYNIIII